MNTSVVSAVKANNEANRLIIPMFADLSMQNELLNVKVTPIGLIKPAQASKISE